MLKGMKRISVLDVCAVLFILFEIILFPLIQFTPGDVSARWSYVAIVLVGVMALVTLRGRSDTDFIRIGILFTLVADYFLVLDGEKLLEGVLAFAVVQAAYFVYLFVNGQSRAQRIANAVSRIAASVILTVAAFVVLGDDTDALAIASVIYYANLVLNTVFAFLLGRRERIFAVGLALFCMCDLCIGLDVLFSSYLGSDALSFLYYFDINPSWIFYQPSQTLIAVHLWYKLRFHSRA